MSGSATPYLRQVVTQRPIAWTQNPDPASIVGDFNDPATHSGQQWVPSVTLQVDGRIDAFTPEDDRAGIVTAVCASSEPSQEFVVVPVAGSSLVELRGTGAAASECLAVNGSYVPIAGAYLVVH